MKRSRWRKTIAAVCLICCFVIGAGAGAQQEKTDQLVQDDADSAGKMVTAQGSSDTGVGVLTIDNQYVYEGMDASYAGGYVPKIEKNKALLILPLLAKQKLVHEQMTVSVMFGGAESEPFVYKNYEKAVSFGYHKTAGRSEKTGCYLVSFALQLKKERINGSYPVTLSVQAEGETGDEIRQDFTVYVTVTDGRAADRGGMQGSSEGGSETGFVIDSKNVYAGMGKSYAKGYVPKVERDEAVLVLPLLTERKLSRKRMAVALTFGEAENLPLVRKNYEKEVRAGRHKVNGTSKKKKCYLAVFRLKLKKDRYNGSYPVTLSVRAQDESGNSIQQDFTVYVTITDGKDAAAEGAQGDGQEEVPQFAPKVTIDSYKFSKKTILCGEKVTAKITLHNTSSTEPIKNMLVSVAPGENVELLGKTPSRYVEQLGAGETVTLSFDFQISAAAPRGQYNIDVTMDYADKKANPYTVQGVMKVSAEQPVQIEIAPVSVPDKIQVGETVELQAQAMNLGKGKIYNVRAVLEADGLTPSGTAFIGDMEPGTSMAGSMELTADGLSGDTLYGTAQGKITFLYEDEAGNEMTQEQLFETSILSPLGEKNSGERVDDTKQWWVVMAVIAVLLVQAAVIFIMRRAKNAPAKEGEGA